MPLDYSFTCPLPNGVHARPASALEEVARSFAAEVVLLNQRTGRTANAKSILSLVGADIRFSDPCLLKVSGSDEDRAMAALGAFIRDTLPGRETALPSIMTANGELRLPPCLENCGAVFRQGTVVAPGIGQGRIVYAGGFDVPQGLPLDGVADAPAEQRRLGEALDELIAWYGERAASAGEGIERELFLAHRSLARDEEFRGCLLEAVASRRRTAAGAIADAEVRFTEVFSKSENALVRERALDIRDVCANLLQRIYGDGTSNRGVALAGDSIVVADSLTPCQFLLLDCRFLKGLVLGEAGTTSHTVILARSFSVPTLVGVANIKQGLADKTEAILDGEIGVLVTGLTEAARRYYRMERQRLEARRLVLRGAANQLAATRDGYKMEIAANIATVEEAERAFAAGAEGIGLFRTEMLFLDRVTPPEEGEQRDIYQRIIDAAEGRPVIIRTMDIGGDKPLDYLRLPPERNPFLGYRAVRIYPQFEPLFRNQARAITRAATRGAVRVMVPMISTLDEFRWARKIIAEEQAACGVESADRKLEVGIMVEVPSVAFAMDEFCREADFFSIGSNDLLQYFMAVDRADSRMASLYNPLQPAFLRLLDEIVKNARAHKKWIGLCGEMGGEKRYLPLLAGMGLDEISVSTAAIGALKAELARYDIAECRQLFESALKCGTAGEVGSLLDKFSTGHSLPLFAPELVVVHADAATKEEAIKRGVDQLYIHGRTGQPRAIEEAVWSREKTYSTGFGHGFAIPHCKSDEVIANSLVVLKFQQPVPWNSADEKAVRIMILMVIREDDGAAEHMKILSALARQLMHEDFRAAIERESDPAALCALLERITAR